MCVCQERGGDRELEGKRIRKGGEVRRYRCNKERRGVRKREGD